MNPDQNPWTDKEITLLRDHWGRDRPVCEIMKVIRRSKNSIVGKAHRLHLTARPNPVAALGQPRPPRAPKPVAPKAATLAPIAAPAPPSAPSSPPPLKVPVRPLRLPCCWPIGDPGSEGFRFCDNPAVVPGKPYCEEHARRAYVSLTLNNVNIQN